MFVYSVTYVSADFKKACEFLETSIKTMFIFLNIIKYFRLYRHDIVVNSWDNQKILQRRTDIMEKILFSNKSSANPVFNNSQVKSFTCLGNSNFIYYNHPNFVEFYLN